MPASRKQLLRLLSWILLLMAGVVAAVVSANAARVRWMSGPSAEQQPSGNSGLVVAPSDLDFGETWENPRFNYVLPIENRQGHDVEIREFASSCTCLEIAPRSLVIPAGQSREVCLTLDLTTKEPAFLHSEWRDFQASIWPRMHDDRQARLEEWKIRGRVRSAICFDKPLVDFGRHSEASQPLPPQKVVVTTFVPLQHLIARSNADALRVQVERHPDAPGQFELVLSPSKLPAEPFRFEVAIVPQLSDGRLLPGKSLCVTGRVVCDFQAAPPAVLLGARQVGETAEETVTLHSLSGQRFSVMGIAIQGEGLVVDQVSEQKAEAPKFLLKQQILKTGQQHGRVVFHVRTRKAGDAEVVVPVSYLGLHSASH